MIASSYGRTVRLFLADGHMDGVVTGRIPGWTGRIVSVPEDRMHALNHRPEARMTGIRLFLGTTTCQDRAFAMVGSDISDDLLRRAWEPLVQKVRHVVVITDADDMLSHEHATWMAHLLSKDIDGAVGPCMERPGSMSRMSESDHADIQRFLGEVRLVVTSLGHRIFTSHDVSRTG